MDSSAVTPREAVELPRRERCEASFYSAERLQALFEVMRDDPLLPLVRITALYGLRRSEVLGLKSLPSAPSDCRFHRL